MLTVVCPACGAVFLNDEAKVGDVCVWCEEDKLIKQEKSSAK